MRTKNSGPREKPKSSPGVAQRGWNPAESKPELSSNAGDTLWPAEETEREVKQDLFREIFPKLKISRRKQPGAQNQSRELN